MTDLTEAQTVLFGQLRERYVTHPKWYANLPAPEEGGIYPPGTLNDLDILRYLKARKWNLEAAMKQLDETLAWRKKNAIDYALDDPHPMALDFKKVVPSCYGLVDKFGRPVLIQRPGLINIPLLKAHISEHTLVGCHAYTQETIRRSCRAQTALLGTPVTKLLSIVDLTGLSMDVKGGLPLMEVMARIDERHYPETLGSTIILNAPSVFSVIWGIAKTFLDADVVAKVCVCSPSESKAKLSEFFDDITILPIELVPEGTPNLFTSADIKALGAQLLEKEAKECTTVTVATRKNHTVDLKVDASNTPQVVTWWFKANDDLKYQVTYAKDGDEKIKTVRALTAVDPHKNPIEGDVYVSAGQTGTITLRLDNTSLFTERRCVFYLRARDAKPYEIALRAQ